MTDKARLLHILDAINFIFKFLEEKSIDDFKNDTLLRFAIERQLEIIGEASNHLSEDLKVLNSEIEWRKIVSFRNFLIHEYFGVDVDLIWSITQNNLDDLKIVVEKIISKF